MTTSADVGARSSAQVLYLSVDLGDRPSLEDYRRNVEALLTLGRYASFVTSPRWADPMSRHPLELPEAELSVVRTSLASPWVTVLADLARTSAPIGYSLTALYALERLLQMVMTWQRHRREMSGGEQRYLRQGLMEETERLASSAHPDLGRRLFDESDPEFGVSEKSSRPHSPPDRFPHVVSTADAAKDLAEIKELEMIPLDDPRAAGGSATA